MDDAIREVNFLARSTPRVQLLEEIYEQGEIEKRELKERVDASRTTIQRNLDALEERGWIEGDNRTYAITSSGRPVTEQFLTLRDTVHAAKRLQPFLAFAPPEEFDLEFHRLATADVTVADESDPYAPVNRRVALMQSADRVRSLSPAAGIQSLLVAHTCLLESGGACDGTYEVVLDPDAAETLRTEDTYLDVLSDLISAEGMTLLVSEDPVPFSLGIADGVVQIGVSDDRGVPRALVESDAGDVRRWANRTFDEYRDAADRFRSRWSDARVPESEAG